MDFDLNVQRKKDIVDLIKSKKEDELNLEFLLEMKEEIKKCNRNQIHIIERSYNIYGKLAYGIFLGYLTKRFIADKTFPLSKLSKRLNGFLKIGTIFIGFSFGYLTIGHYKVKPLGEKTNLYIEGLKLENEIEPIFKKYNI